jgi:hypothetical protein
MVEDQYLEMKYITTDNAIIGYTSTMIQIFDLRRINKNNEKYVDKMVNLNNIFESQNKKIFFTNYFMNNFPGYLKDTLKEFNRGCYRDEPFRITSSLIYCYNENPSIYYIMGTSTGKVGIFDIFFTEEIKLSPILYIDTHKASIETLSIYENRLLIISSSDGMISFTDISPVKLRNAFKSVTTNIDNIDPNFINSMKQYYGSIKKGVDRFNKKYIPYLITSYNNISFLNVFQSYTLLNTINPKITTIRTNLRPRWYNRLFATHITRYDVTSGTIIQILISKN